MRHIPKTQPRAQTSLQVVACLSLLFFFHTVGERRSLLFPVNLETRHMHPNQLNAEEYETLDHFEDDLKLMAEEAKEVRDRLKADLAAAEAHAAALERGVAAAGAAESGVVVGGGVAGGGGGSAGGANGGRGGGDDGGLRRALMEVDRATNRLARAATAVDMACFLRDAALSYLLE